VSKHQQRPTLYDRERLANLPSLSACDGPRSKRHEPDRQTTGPKLLDANAVAEMLGCSTRHVYRLSDAGRMPRPVKLGALVRWSRDALESWIAAGCPATRN